MTSLPNKTDLYKKLAIHLDKLPGGYPETSSGVEIRILKKLFSRDEAYLACSLALISETAEVISLRSGMHLGKTAVMLDKMADKGLIFSTKEREKPDVYMAAQFVVGIWEYQVGSLDQELVRMMDEYIPHLFKPEDWKKAPQMRIVPVKKSIDTRQRIMSYEQAEKLLNKKENFVVTPCICRLEQKKSGKGCEKPIESCISFGDQNDYYVRNGLGKSVAKQEIIRILRQADKSGLVIQPSNGKDITWICLCCGCCCGVLRTLNNYPEPADLVSTPFIVKKDEDGCNNCGVCIKRCQTNAICLDSEILRIDKKRCIGCGLCVSTCPKKCLTLHRKKRNSISKVPGTIVTASLKMLFKRKKMNILQLFTLFINSKKDRFRVYMKNR
ncbi:MAG: 4Fe-4S ferredoxin [Desulfobacterales bacterium]|nr:4Fe-4S ferredoxin [Desulfobacterales bacterium]MCP4161943.1 4Fe-4S ferredoxin [Deltaproteobacteria bacterium]